MCSSDLQGLVVIFLRQQRLGEAGRIVVSARGDEEARLLQLRLRLSELLLEVGDLVRRAIRVPSR